MWVMRMTIQVFYIVYTVCTLAAAVGLTVAALLAVVGERRRRERDVRLRAEYLRLLLSALEGENPCMPAFPEFGRRGTRRILCETVAGVVAITYGLNQEALRQVVGSHGLDRWMLRRVRRSRGYRRAHALALLACLPSDGATAAAAGCYLRSRNRYVRFYALTVQLAAEPAHALRRIGEYRAVLSASEVAELMALLRRGILPLAYVPLLEARAVNLRRVGLAVVRQFGIEEAEGRLLQFVADTAEPELGREALYALCSLRRSLLRREVAVYIVGMDDRERRALLRCMALEGYAVATMQRLFDEAERPYYETIVRSYKRSLA